MWTAAAAGMGRRSRKGTGVSSRQKSYRGYGSTEPPRRRICHESDTFALPAVTRLPHPLPDNTDGSCSPDAGTRVAQRELAMRPPRSAYIDVMTTARGKLLRRRDDLRQLRDSLSADLGDSAASQGAEGVLATHPADAASDLVTAETSLGDLRSLDAELDEIDQALSRIERGTYGLCTDCGEPIDPARLRALPTAARCFRCQERHERAAAG